MSKEHPGLRDATNCENRVLLYPQSQPPRKILSTVCPRIPNCDSNLGKGKVGRPQRCSLPSSSMEPLEWLAKGWGTHERRKQIWEFEKGWPICISVNGKGFLLFSLWGVACSKGFFLRRAGSHGQTPFLGPVNTQGLNINPFLKDASDSIIPELSSQGRWVNLCWKGNEKKKKNKHRYSCLAASTIPMTDHRDPWEPLLDTNTHGESSFTLHPTKSRLNCLHWVSLHGKAEAGFCRDISAGKVPHSKVAPLLMTQCVWDSGCLQIPYSQISSCIGFSPEHLILWIPPAHSLQRFRDQSFLSPLSEMSHPSSPPPNPSEKVVNVSSCNSVMTYEPTLRSGLSKYKK